MNESSAKPDDWQTPLQAANYMLNNRGDLTQALAWAEQSIKARENFNNLNLKARILAAQGKTAEAVAAGEKALQVGRAAFEKTRTRRRSPSRRVRKPCRVTASCGEDYLIS